MKTIRIIFLLSILNLGANAQNPPTYFPLMNPIWKLIGEKSYIQNKDRKMVVTFPARLKALNNTVIEMRGYLVPIKIGLEFDMCYLSILPVEQCYFCGSNGVPSMIELRLTKPIRYVEKPVKVRGKLKLNETADDNSEIFMLEAKIVD